MGFECLLKSELDKYEFFFICSFILSMFKSETHIVLLVKHLLAYLLVISCETTKVETDFPVCK
jgi:D-alanyl-lipoteichoic acid acyltransferase DltB (MBOAT superfamily)